jgi:hypothetical protein
MSDQNLFGPVSGRVTGVAIDPTDVTGNTVYVAAASGGVWKSTNATTVPATGVAWTPLTDQQASLVNGAVSVNSDGSVVLVGTGEPDSAIDSYYGVGVLRSTDHGATWTLIPAADSGTNPFAGLGFSKFAWDSSAPNTVVAASGTTTQGFDDGDITSTTNRGLYYSNNSGQTWAFQIPQDSGVAISPASISATDVVYNAAAGKYFAAIRYHGLYSSANGQNWTRLANQPNPTSLNPANCPAQIPPAGSNCPIYRGQLSVVPGREEMYFWFVSIGTQNGEEDVVDQGIWRSLDGGNSWAQVDETGITNCGDPGNNGCGVDQGYYNLEIAALPDGPATDLYAGAVNLFKCELTANGTTCSTLDNNYPNQWINLTHVYGCSSIASVHPDEHGLDFMLVGGKAVMYFGNDGGIYRTLDGFTKLLSGTCGVPNGFDNLNASTVQNGTIGSLTQFISFSLDPTDQNTVLGGAQGNGSPATSSATGGPEWSTVNGGDGGYNAINASPDWPPMEWYTSNPYVNIYACPNGIHCTTDNFSLTVGSEEVGGDSGAFYTSYILDPQDPNQIIVGTCRVWSGAPTVPPSSLSALSFDFDTLGSNTCTGEEINLVRGLDAGGPQNNFVSTTVYATTEGTGPNATSPSGGEVWVTTNAGITPMSQITGSINPLNYTISSAAVDLSDTTGATAYVGIMGFLGTGTHIWKTTNDGATWSPFGSLASGLPDAPVNALLVDAQSHNLYAGTDVGVFVTSTTATAWNEVGAPSQPGASGYLPNVPVSAIRLFNYGGTKKLRVSTYGRGLWEFVLSPDFSIVISNPSQTAYPGQTATFNGTLTAFNGYARTVNLSCVGAVPGPCTFIPSSSLVPTAVGTPFTVNVESAAAGTFNFGIQATDGTLTHTEAVSLTVATDISWTDTGNSSATVEAGGNATYDFSAAPLGGTTFSSAVTFACANLPALTGCTFSPVSIAAGAGTTPVTLTISTIGPYSGDAIRQGRHAALRESYQPPTSARPGGFGAARWWLLTFPIVGILFAGFARRRPDKRFLVAGSCIALAWALLLISCGGALGGGGGGTQPVTITPSSATVPINGTQQFTANQNVTWDVSGTGNGSISGNGLYTAPSTVPNPATVTVTATSAVQGTTPGSATVTITNPQVTVSVSPFSANLYANQPGNTWAASATQQQFSATVNNAGSQTVTWAVTGGDTNGTIDANGLYSTPAVAPNPATVTVTATSTLAASAGSATVNIQTATTVGTYSNIQVTATATGGTPHEDAVSLTVQ